MKNFKAFFLIKLLVVFSYGCGKSDPIEEQPKDKDPEIEIAGLVAWHPLDEESGKDRSENNNDGVAHNVIATSNRHGEEGKASYFNGENSYIEIPDQNYLSIASTKELTISIWMKLEVLNFPSSEREDYVHWLGKGERGHHEYTFRIYNLNSYRPNRVSGYVFNPSGGLGAGSMFEEKLYLDRWMHVVVVYDYPNDRIKIYRDGRQRSQSTFSSYAIIPRDGSAPLRIGTRDFASYFQGHLDDLKIFKRVLTDKEISTLFEE